jgi:hypothetical protein
MARKKITTKDKIMPRLAGNLLKYWDAISSTQFGKYVIFVFGTVIVFLREVYNS